MSGQRHLVLPSRASLGASLLSLRLLLLRR
jgi:hypothetical protein